MYIYGDLANKSLAVIQGPVQFLNIIVGERMFLNL